MFGLETKSSPEKIGFLLLPNFSMIAFTASIEPLRSANRMSRKTLYEWQTLSLDGLPVMASNGVTITPDKAVRFGHDSDVVFVCAGTQPQRHLSSTLQNELRSLALRGKALGAVCTGSFALAYAGILTGYKCTIHWEDIESFKEIYPNLDITATLFEIDRNRFTCSGGTAPLDMMIYSIKLDHGETLALNVAEQMLHNFVREPEDNQRMAIEHRTGIQNPKLLAAIGLMEVFIETPIALDKLARRVGISIRQMERLFRSELETTPAKYYLSMRLERARQFLRRTPMSILEIGIATGFNSSSHFAKSYKDKFGHSPKAERNP